jgi:hypothetical protein
VTPEEAAREWLASRKFPLHESLAALLTACEERAREEERERCAMLVAGLSTHDGYGIRSLREKFAAAIRASGAGKGDGK